MRKPKLALLFSTLLAATAIPLATASPAHAQEFLDINCEEGAGTLEVSPNIFYPIYGKAVDAKVKVTIVGSQCVLTDDETREVVAVSPADYIVTANFEDLFCGKERTTSLQPTSTIVDFADPSLPNVKITWVTQSFGADGINATLDARGEADNRAVARGVWGSTAASSEENCPGPDGYSGGAIDLATLKVLGVAVVP